MLYGYLVWIYVRVLVTQAKIEEHLRKQNISNMT